MSRAQRSLVIALLTVLVVAIAGRYILGLGENPWGPLFHIVPAAVALIIIMSKASNTEKGRFMRGTTIVLAFIAVLAGEGAFCVVIAAPFVYLVMWGVWGVTQLGSKLGSRYRHQSATLLILTLGISFGSGLGAPELSTATATTTSNTNIETTISQLAEARSIDRLDTGLLASRLPQLRQISGGSLEPGSTRSLTFDGGAVQLRVLNRSADEITFEALSDTTMSADWIRWDGATFRFSPTASGGTEVEMEIEYELLLQPAWYFGPIVDRGLDEATSHIVQQLFVNG